MADEQQEQFFISIDALQEVGISAADLNKIKASGISTVLGVQQATRKSLTKIKGMSDAKVEKLKDAAAKVLPSAFRTGAEVQNHRQSVIMISVGSKQVDAMLGGGVSTQSTTEIYGEFRTGKTQLCHTLCVTCQMDKEDGGASGKVAYIDTENTFRPDRIKAIAERFGLDGEAALENIVVGRALNSEHQMDLINALAAKFADEGSYKLLIIDSILALFRVDFCGRGELSERQQKLNQMLARLTRISEEYNIAVVYTNHVQADPGASSMFAGAADKKPVGGHVLSHASTTRISLRKARGEERIAKLADSPDQPESEASYKIAAGGIADV